MHVAFLRLALTLILQSAEDDLLAFFGIPCGTYVRVSQGSTHRCPFLAMGSVLSMSVYFANKLTSRPNCNKKHHALSPSPLPKASCPAFKVNAPHPGRGSCRRRPGHRAARIFHPCCTQGFQTCQWPSAKEADVCFLA